MKNSLSVFAILYRDRLPIRTLNVLLQFLLFSSFLILSVLFLNINNYFLKLGSKVTFYAFLRKSTSPDEATKIRNTIQNWPEVNTIKLINPDEGLKILKKSLGKESDILYTLETNPLPITLEINIKKEFTEKIYIQQISDRLNKFSSIEWFDTTEKYLGNVVSLRRTVMNIFIGGVFLFALIIIISLRIMANCVIDKYQEKFKLLQMLGASKRFIVAPFIFEGFIESFLTSLFAVISTNYLLLVLKEDFEKLEVNIQQLPLNFYIIFILLVSISGALCNIPNTRKLNL